MKNPGNINNFDKKVKVFCMYEAVCSGCQLLHVPYEEQLELKKNELWNLFQQCSIQYTGDFDVLSAGPAYLRNRLDFSFENGNLGLFKKNKKEILDIQECHQLAPELEQFLKEIRKINWPFQRGSLRLRTSPSGDYGIWLDLSNIDIKNLLSEKKILLHLLRLAHVEIGQRRKVPNIKGDEIKLGPPENKVWFQTWVKDQPINLFCQIGSFTQPSFRANKLICHLLSDWLKEFNNSRLIEFGSGIGNLTLPASGVCQSIVACELDQLALAGFQQTLENLPSSLNFVRDRIKIQSGDFQRKVKQDFNMFDGIIANPPRSGLMGFISTLNEIEKSNRPEFFIYMSCFPESLVKDLMELQKNGYKAVKTCIIDQFPQTKHFEVMILLQRK